MFSLEGLPVKLDILEISIAINKFVGMNPISIHFSIAFGRTQIRINLSQHMSAFGHMAKEVKEAIWVLYICNW